MENKKFQLILNSKIYTIPSIFKHLIDINPKISTSLIFEPDHKYQVESLVSNETFESFLRYMLQDDIPDIHLEDIQEYYQLSQEFQIFNETIESKINEFGDYYININALQNNKSGDLAVNEEKIATQLDDYLKKYGKELLNVPIQSLFNIFNHKNRQLTHHDLAYELIKQHFDSTKNSGIFILLNSLDGSKLSKSNFEESVALKESRLNCMPVFDFSYLSNLFEKQKKLEELVNQIGQKIDLIVANHEEEKKKLIEKFEGDKRQLIDEHERDKKSLIERIENEKSEIIMKNEDNLSKIEKKHSEEINKLAERIEVLSKQIGDTKMKNEEEIKVMKESLNDKLNEISEIVQKVNGSFNDQREKIESSESNFGDPQKEKVIEKSKEFSDTLRLHEKKFSAFYKKFGILSFELNLNQSGILGNLKKLEKNPFDRFFIASQSSRDVYNLIDPKTKDDFRFANSTGNYVEFYLEEEVEINGVQIFSSFEYFPKSFRIEIDGKEMKSVSEANELNGQYKDMTVTFDPVRGQKVRFIQTGRNWDKDNNYVRIKRIEILSNERKYSNGIFSTLVRKSDNNDPHKCPVFISSSNFDLNKFYKLDVPSDQNICMYDVENSWFQIELTRGFAILEGFRFNRGDNSHKTKSYKIICTDDISKQENSWIVLLEINESSTNEHKGLDIYKFSQPSPPVKFIRLIQTGKNWTNDDYLAFYCFDLYGSYF